MLDESERVLLCFFFEKASFGTQRYWCCEVRQIMKYSEVRDYSE